MHIDKGLIKVISIDVESNKQISAILGTKLGRKETGAA